ncbi:YdcF family protein [Candidatus Nomurabacteria bacterium]|nr:YdcF family protein [Candidatus Nomurabacteria bacterium]
MNEEEVKKITEYLFLKENVVQADLGFVFGTIHYKELVDLVSKLDKEKFFNKILISGGKKFPESIIEAKSIATALIKKGIKAECLLLEDKATNTLENVLFSRRLLKSKGALDKIDSILLITKNYHSRRALMTIKKYFPKDIKFSLATYDAYGFNKDDWWVKKENNKRVVNEFKKIERYLAKGDIKEL